jgi:hypothetical protein
VQTLQRSTRSNRSTLLLGLGAAAFAACTGSADPAGPNEACFRALDCEDGLVCIEGRCTSDIATIVPGGRSAAQSAGAADAGAPP